MKKTAFFEALWFNVSLNLQFCAHSHREVFFVSWAFFIFFIFRRENLFSRAGWNTKLIILLFLPCKLIVHVVLFDLSSTITDVAAAILKSPTKRKNTNLNFFYIDFFHKQKIRFLHIQLVTCNVLFSAKYNATMTKCYQNVFIYTLRD